MSVTPDAHERVPDQAHGLQSGGWGTPPCRDSSRILKEAVVAAAVVVVVIAVVVVLVLVINNTSISSHSSASDI